MALYEFQCEAGHVTQKVMGMKDRHPKTVQCASCPLRARRVFSSAAVRPDFPEHFNWSLGMVIKNRKHHEQVQRERGLMDWEPCRNSPGSQLSMGRAR